MCRHYFLSKDLKMNWREELWPIPRGTNHQIRKTKWLGILWNLSMIHLALRISMLSRESIMSTIKWSTGQSGANAMVPRSHVFYLPGSSPIVRPCIFWNKEPLAHRNLLSWWLTFNKIVYTSLRSLFWWVIIPFTISPASMGAVAFAAVATETWSIRVLTATGMRLDS